MFMICRTQSTVTFQLKLFVKLSNIPLRANLQWVQPISVFNGILARVSLYIDGHVVFVPMEKQRNNTSQMEAYNYIF